MKPTFHQTVDYVPRPGWSISPASARVDSRLKASTKPSEPRKRTVIFPEESESTSPKTSTEQSNPLRTTSQGSHSSSKKRKPKLTMIGSSIVRNTGPIIAESLKDYDTFVSSRSGLSLDNVRHDVENIAEDNKPEDTVVLQLGSVDVGKFNSDPYVIASTYSTLINNIVQNTVCKIAVCAVPYRIGDKVYKLNQRIDQLNSILRLVCNQNERLVFWDVNPGAMPAYYLNDGLHFNLDGTKLYVQYLVDKVKNVNFVSVDSLIML